MSVKNRFTALFLTTALIAAPAFSVTAYAHDHDHGASMEMHHEHMQLTDAQKKALMSAMHRVHESNKPVIEQMHKLHEQLHAVVAADKFDSKTFLALTSQIEAKRMQIERSHVQAFASIADQFTPEQRKHILHKMAQHEMMKHAHMMMHHGEGHEGWHHHHDGADGEHHEGWMHHDESNNVPAPDNDANSATVSQPHHDDGYPPYAPR